MSDSVREPIGDDEQAPEDVEAVDTPIGRVIAERPEVRGVDINFGHECVVILVTFDTWSIPSDFAQQYDMYLASAGIVDPRPRWKQMFGVGRSSYIQARFVRDGRDLR